MKRLASHLNRQLLAFAASLLLAFPVFATDLGIDVTTLTDSDLLYLYELVDNELGARLMSPDTSLYSGLYLVGEDVKEGSYLFTGFDSDYSEVLIFSDLDAYENFEASGFKSCLTYNKVLYGDTCTVNITEGQYLWIAKGKGRFEDFSAAWTPETEAVTEQPSLPAPETQAIQLQPESAAPTVSEDTIRPEVKAAIDAYEAFMVSYYDFMANYDATNFSAMAQYFALMEQYYDEIEKLDALEGDLTYAENLYLLDMLNRVNAYGLQSIQ